MSAFEVSVMEGKGRVLVATRNIRPGEFVILKQGPLLRCTFDQVSRHNIPVTIMSVLNRDRTSLFVSVLRKTFPSNCSVPATLSNNDSDIAVKSYLVYRSFLAMPDASRQEYLTLYGPDDSPKAEVYHSLANDLKNVCRWSVMEAEQFVKVSLIKDFNAFGNEVCATVFGAPTTFISHSCKPNCTYVIEGSLKSVYAIVPIKVGDEMTISYNTRNHLPIHIRRMAYRANKGFICDCPRCSALGDDMRQFNCYDEKCSGRHWVCQPLENVVPYLLPCSQCKRAPSQEYQTEMLELESTLEPLGKEAYDLGAKGGKFVDMDPSVAVNMLSRISKIRRLPQYHGSTAVILMAMIHLTGVVKEIDVQFQFISTLYSVLNNLTLTMSPDDYLADMFYHVGDFILHSAFTTHSRNSLGIRSAQRAIRMSLLVRGRDSNRIEKYDQRLVELLTNIDTNDEKTVMTECMFCRESPENVAIKLSLCGKCKQVAYCSKGCQKAHWKVHKGRCCK